MADARLRAPRRRGRRFGAASARAGAGTATITARATTTTITTPLARPSRSRPRRRSTGRHPRSSASAAGLLPCPSALVVLLSRDRAPPDRLRLRADRRLQPRASPRRSPASGSSPCSRVAPSAASRSTGRVVRALPALSALVILGVGLAITVKALPGVVDVAEPDPLPANGCHDRRSGDVRARRLDRRAVGRGVDRRRDPRRDRSSASATRPIPTTSRRSRRSLPPGVSARRGRPARLGARGASATRSRSCSSGSRSCSSSATCPSVVQQGAETAGRGADRLPRGAPARPVASRRLRVHARTADDTTTIRVRTPLGRVRDRPRARDGRQRRRRRAAPRRDPVASRSRSSRSSCSRCSPPSR